GLHDNQIGTLQLPVHSSEHPLRDGHLFPRTPKITFALPEAIIGQRMAVWRIDDLQSAAAFGRTEQFSSITQDSMHDLRVGPWLSVEPPTPYRKKGVKGPFDPDLGSPEIKRCHRVLKSHAAAKA